MVTAQGKGKQPRAKKRAVEGPSSTASSSTASSSLPRPTKLSKATKVKTQPKVSERKKIEVEPQKPVRPPSPRVDVPQKRPFPPLSTLSSSDNDSSEEGEPVKSAPSAPRPVPEGARPGDGGVAHQTMSGFLPQTAAVSSSSSSGSDSSSDASSSEGEQQVCGQWVLKGPWLGCMQHVGQARVNRLCWRMFIGQATKRLDVKETTIQASLNDNEGPPLLLCGICQPLYM